MVAAVAATVSKSTAEEMGVAMAEDTRVYSGVAMMAGCLVGLVQSVALVVVVSEAVA